MQSAAPQLCGEIASAPPRSGRGQITVVDRLTSRAGAWRGLAPTQGLGRPELSLSKKRKGKILYQLGPAASL